MVRVPTRLLVPALIALFFLVPALASAQPDHKEVVRPAVERPVAGPGLLSKIRGLLSALWAGTGSGLEPDGTAANGSGTTSEPTSPGGTGSGLEPDGRP